MEKYKVIIPAAGQGKRMGAGMNKQFLQLRNEPLIVHTLRYFEQDVHCGEVVLVVNEDDRDDMAALVKTYGMNKVSALVRGGSERQQSVYEGVKFFASVVEKEQVILVHDGARPFVTEEVVAKLVEHAEQYGASTTAVRVKDTIKRVKDDKVVDTLDRSELWSIQTPQAFRLSLLLEAHEQAERDGQIGTDDAMLVEWLGHEVFITEGDYHNIKLTTKEDLLFAEAILQERSEKKHD